MTPVSRPILGTAALLSALALGFGVSTLSQQRSAAPEQGVLLVAVSFAVLLIVATAGYFLLRRTAATPAEAALVVVAGSAVLAVAAFVAAVRSELWFPADILIWSESPFVNDIIKLRAGVPVYGSPADLSSFFYTPGAQALTLGLARLFGAGDSLPLFRVLQVGFVVTAALLGLRAVYRIRGLAGLGAREELPWELLWVPLLFLCGSNQLTNPFTHLLHNDALALLVSTLAFLLLLDYAAKRRPGTLVWMTVIPLAGFAVKQSLAIWLGLYLGFLVGFDRPRSWKRIVWFGLGAAGWLAAGYAAARAVWGAPFQYWVVTVMGHHPPSLLRALQHVLDTWPYWAAGLGAGLVLIRTGPAGPLFGCWLVWLVLFATEAYTSGIAWMLNHLGPGSMLAAIWLAAALPELWRATLGAGRGASAWLRAGALAALALLGFAGLGLVRVPAPALPADAGRYVSAIEAEFAGLPADQVLLDSGSWPYLEAGVVMRDRSAVVGELGVTETGDLSGLFERLRTQQYRRILLRDLDTPDFPYDHGLWRVSSGVRDSLHAYYQVVRRIPAVSGTRTAPIGLREISVLEPRRP